MGDKKVIDDLEKSINNLKQQSDQIYALINKGDAKNAEKLAITEGSGYYQAYVESIKNAKAVYNDEMDDGIRFDEEISTRSSKAMITSTTICITSILTGVAICIYITKSLKDPIEEIEDSCK